MKPNHHHFDLILNKVLVLHESKRMSDVNLRVRRKWCRLSQNRLNVLVECFETNVNSIQNNRLAH
jgi:hypothetical protein